MYDIATGLAEAMPVGDMDDSVADTEVTPVNMDALKKKERENHSKKKKVFLLLLVALACIVLIAVLVGVTLSKNSKDSKAAKQQKPPTPFPSSAPTEFPSSSPTGALDLFLETLAGYTLDRMNNFSSPQWKAKDWLENHPNVTAIPEWKKRQKFALSTFYYAMDGDKWPEPIRERWLQYDKDECFWFSDRFGSISENGSYQENLWDWEVGNPCNELDEFVTLMIRFYLQPQENLPPEIALLSSLSSLSLQENTIRSPLSEFLPSEFYQLTS